VDRALSSAAVTCPSNVVRADLLDAGFSHEQIHVVPWGVDIIDVSGSDVERVRGKYGLPTEFVLAVATMEPRKNLPRLVEAHRQVRDAPPLVIAGPSGWGDVSTALRSSSPDVIFPGHIDRSDLRAVYSAAKVFAYPSEEEGFGLPVLEAMAANTAVVTSSGTATEEVAAGAAELVDPFDVESIAAGLSAALSEPSDLQMRGRQRVHECSWHDTAQALVAVYEAVAGS